MEMYLYMQHATMYMQHDLGHICADVSRGIVSFVHASLTLPSFKEQFSGYSRTTGGEVSEFVGIFEDMFHL